MLVSDEYRFKNCNYISMWFCYELCPLFDKIQQIRKEEGVDKFSEQLRHKGSVQAKPMLMQLLLT